MNVHASTCGLDVAVRADDPWWTAFTADALGGSDCLTGQREPDVVITVDRARSPFDTSAMTPLTRGAYSDGQAVVLQDACGSGLDLLVAPEHEVLHVTARVRTRASQRGLELLLPARATLLRRAALLQYPLLWWAGRRGAVPLHVSAAIVEGRGVVLAGPGGVGKSTLMQSLSPAAGAPLSDNLCTYDGSALHTLHEPRRVEATGHGSPHGRRMPHGRTEQGWARRASRMTPDLVLVLRRGAAEQPAARSLTSAETARVLTAGTYAAGELRRYWAFAATLALGTGLGPAHPSVFGAAAELASSVPGVEVTLPRSPGTPLTELVALANREHDRGTLEASA